MSLSNRLAWRYLFGKKSTNAINVITAIAGIGVMIGAMALILVLSFFNGFENLFLDMFDDLNPDVRISAIKGKTFVPADSLVWRLQHEIEGIEIVSETLEETAFFQYGSNRNPGQFKGVDEHYVGINRIDTMVRRGRFGLGGQGRYSAILGRQMSLALNVDIDDPYETLLIYMPRRRRSAGGMFSSQQPFFSRAVTPVATISTPEAFENQAVIIHIDLARELLQLSDGSISALEIKLADGYDRSATYRAIQQMVGPDFEVANRFQQESGLLSLMRIEKWVGFAIAGLMMLLISFNLVGALWMIVLEKKRDIAILRSMGMTPGDIRSIFLRLGLNLCSLSLLVGVILAFIVVLLQQQVGLFRLPGPTGEPLPIAMRLTDLPILIAVVLGIGYLASILPAQRATRVDAVVREE